MTNEIKKPELKELAFFAREWSALLEAGIPAIEGLMILAQRKERKFLSFVAQHQETGQSLSDGFRQTKLFPPFFCALLRIGELSGTLPTQLEVAATYYTRERDLHEKIKSACYYPATLLIATILLFFF